MALYAGFPLIHVHFSPFLVPQKSAKHYTLTCMQNIEISRNYHVSIGHMIPLVVVFAATH